MKADYTKEAFLPFSFISQATSAWWDRVFAQYFKHKQYFLTDVDKLKNVRNAISHFRPITHETQAQAVSICERLIGIVHGNMPAELLPPSLRQSGEITSAGAREGTRLHAEVERVYTVRGDAQLDVRMLLESAERVEAMGISVNAMTKRIDDRTYRKLLQRGTHFTLLMLDPDGSNTEIREAEERCDSGYIAGVTRHNLQRVARFKRDLTEDGRSDLADQIEIVLYDEIPRCNMIFFDEEALFVQYYAGHVKGENNPTFYFRRQQEDGVFDFYRRLFSRTLTRWRTRAD